MQQAPQFCNHCGAANPVGARFCAFCGLAGIGATAKSVTGMLPSAFFLKQRYQIVDRIGQGGFGAVYEAEDGQFGHAQRAIKEMSVSSLDPAEVTEATEAFKQEAMLLANLMHPNLPRIYDHFEEQGHWYLVMDFVQGETLEDRLAKAAGGHFALAEVIQLGLQLCDVLGYLHGHQPPIIFRDLKPANVMVTQDNHLYLVDFGIARLFKPGQSRDTRVLGSPGYAAPEQYGRAQTTERADIYSLGASLHQFISGRDPSDDPFQFPALNLDQYGAQGQALAALVMSMVEMNKDKRPGNVQVVRDELQRIAQLSSQLIAGATMGVLPGIANMKTLPLAGPVATLIVDQSGRGDHTSINDAIKAAIPGTQILIHPGLYSEQVLFDTDVVLIGDGALDKIILQGCISVQTNRGAIHNLTIMNISANHYAIDIPQGELLLTNCDITSASWTSVAIHNAGTHPIIQNCLIHDGAQGGVYIFYGARATIENCRIFSHQIAGIEITTGANPLFRRCKMYGNGQHGASVHASGSGVFEECEFFNNMMAGVEIMTEGGPVLRNCRFYDNRRDGVRIQSRGMGVFEGCDFAANTLAGLVVAAQGNPNLQRCVLRANKQNGALVHRSGLGMFRECEFAGNMFSGMAIEEMGNPHVIRCQFHDGKQNGVLVSEHGQGIFEDCLFFANEFPGMAVSTDATPQVRRGKFYNNEKSGVYVYDGGQGSFEQCEFFANKRSGLVISTKGMPFLTRCRFHDGQGSGATVSDQGEGTFEDCEFTANLRAGLEILDGGYPSLFRCKFENGRDIGVRVANNGKGKLVDCRIIDHSASGVEISKLGDPFFYHCRIAGNQIYGVWVHDDGRGSFEECFLRSNVEGPWEIENGSIVRLRDNDG